MTPRRPDVVDATKPLCVVIGEQDRDALRADPARCVGANRIVRAPGVADARVGATTARVLRGDTWHRYFLDPDTVAAVRAYDAAGETIPAGFRFRLIPPPEGKRLDDRAGERQGGPSPRRREPSSVSSRHPSLRNIWREPA